MERGSVGPTNVPRRKAFDARRRFRDPNADDVLNASETSVDWSRPITEWLVKEQDARSVEEQLELQREWQARTEGNDRNMKSSRVLIEANSPRLEVRWCLVFKPRTGQMSNMQEVWSMCVRMWGQGLHIRHSISKDKTALYIQVGATNKILREEAEKISLKMRLRNFKGMCPYSPNPTAKFVETPNGTVFNSAQEQRLVISRINRALVLALDSRISMDSRENYTERMKKKIDSKNQMSSRFLMQLLTTYGANIEEHAAKIGPATLKCCRLVHFDPFFSVECSSESASSFAAAVVTSVENVDIFATADVAQEAMEEATKETMRGISKGTKTVRNMALGKQNTGARTRTIRHAATFCR